MGKVFLTILDINIVASCLIITIILLRLLLRKLARSYCCALWVIVGIRLCCPFSVESLFGLFSQSTIAPFQSTIAPLSDQMNKISSQQHSANPQAPLQPIVPETALSDLSGHNTYVGILDILAIIWLVGIIAMIAYMAISYTVTMKRTKACVCLRDNIFMCDYIEQPFTIGVLHPCICIPSKTSTSYVDCVVEHERSHIRRFDHIWKLIGFIVLSVHWFDPLVWFAYKLFSQDIEFACDNAVTSKMDTAQKKLYAEALLLFSAAKTNEIYSPTLALGRKNTYERVKMIMTNKKKPILVSIISIVLCVILLVCFFTVRPIIGERYHNTDIADIKGMNIGAQMPDVLYGNDEYVISSGAFGVLVFDVINSEVIARIPVKKLDSLGVEFMGAIASKDGKTVYLSSQKDYSVNWKYSYDLTSHKLISCNQPEDTASAQYSQEINRRYYDGDYLYSETIAETEDGFYYMRAATNWSMDSLQLVKVYYATGEQIVFDVFR